MQKNEKESKIYTIYDARPDTGGPVLGAIEGLDEQEAIENWASLVSAIERVDRCDVDSEDYFAQDVGHSDELYDYLRR
jgi:hypothetical protein